VSRRHEGAARWCAQGSHSPRRAGAGGRSPVSAVCLIEQATGIEPVELKNCSLSAGKQPARTDQLYPLRPGLLDHLLRAHLVDRPRLALLGDCRIARCRTSDIRAPFRRHSRRLSGNWTYTVSPSPAAGSPGVTCRPFEAWTIRSAARPSASDRARLVFEHRASQHATGNAATPDSTHPPDPELKQPRPSLPFAP